MNFKSEIDEKGRVRIPQEIRKKLKIQSGDNLLFEIKDEKIFIRKSISIEEFIEASEKFSKKLKDITNEPIEFKKEIGSLNLSQI